jgi:hypothetical protein
VAIFKPHGNTHSFFFSFFFLSKLLYIFLSLLYIFFSLLHFSLFTPSLSLSLFTLSFLYTPEPEKGGWQWRSRLLRRTHRKKNQPNQKKLIPTPLNFAHSFQIQTPNHQKPYQLSGSEGKSFEEKLFTLALFTFPILISVSNFSSSFLFRFVSGLVFVLVPCV